MATVTITSPGAGSWVALGTAVVVEVWGGGASGGPGYISPGYGGGGGGGGAYSKKAYTLTFGQSYNYVVGAGGAAPSGFGVTGNDGADSYFENATSCMAKGGSKGSQGAAGSGGAGGAGGAAASGYGDTKYSGGDGATGTSLVGGGGGSSAGTDSNGNNASGQTGGTAPTAGGAGGDGGDGASGQSGTSPGGGSGGADAQSANGAVGRDGQLVITYTPLYPDTPTISAPTSSTGAAPQATFDLTASATHQASAQVKYRWKYSYEGGADQTIGDTGLVNSGTPETYSWDTSALDHGTYELKCWAVDAVAQTSAEYDSVTIYIGDVQITAPTDGSSYASGEINLTGKGYLATTGRVQIQWEIDTNETPDSGSDNYDIITSGIIDQDTSSTVVATVGSLGTWYIRARTKDQSETPNYSSWTSVISISVLEKILLDSGSQVEQTILGVANKVYVKASGTATVATATNTTTAPTYANSPREVFVIAPEDADSTACAAIATAQLALRKAERLNISGLVVKLEDGMKLNRGDQVGVYIERMGIDGTYPIRELQFDVANDKCTVTVGDFWEPITDQDALVAIAQKLQSIEREAAA